MERFHAHTSAVPRDGRLADTFTRKRLSLTGSVDTIAGTRLLLHCPGTLFRLSYQFLGWLEIADAGMTATLTVQ